MSKIDRSFRIGDIIFTKNESERKFNVFKILRIENWRDGSDTWHVLWYTPLSNPPKVDDLKSLTIMALHAPVTSLAATAEFITNIPVAPEELAGYFTYLKQTNFSKYLEETGQDANVIIQQAQNYFRNW